MYYAYGQWLLSRWGAQPASKGGGEQVPPPLKPRVYQPLIKYKIPIYSFHKWEIFKVSENHLDYTMLNGHECKHLQNETLDILYYTVSLYHRVYILVIFIIFCMGVLHTKVRTTTI